MGLFTNLKNGLSKTRDNIVSGFNNIFNSFSSIDDDFYDELEETMIMGDIGVSATESIIDDLKEKVRENRIKEPAECKQLLIDSIKEKMNLGDNAYDFDYHDTDKFSEAFRNKCPKIFNNSLISPFSEHR